MPMQDQRDAHEASLDRLHRRLRTLCQCTMTFFHAESEQELLQSVCEILVVGGEVRLAWIGYCEDDAEKLVRPVAQAGSGLDYLERVETSWGERETGQGPAGIAARTGKACCVDDIRTDPRFSPWRVAALARGYASCIAVPLMTDGKSRGAVDLRGTLNLYSAECNAFDESAIEHYTGLAMSVAYAVTALRGHLAEDLAYGVTAVRASAERKRAEEALHQAREELAHVTRVTTLGELAASIAHEINQPLAAIVADANASLNWLAAADPDLDMVRDALAAVVSDGHRAGDVIQRIRQLATKTDPQRARVEINDVIRDMLPLVRTEVRSHDVSLRLDLAPALRPVRGDRVQLQQVLSNLVMNGIEAMAAVADRPRELVIRSGPHEGDQVLVAVEDAGVGIDPSSVNELFSAFFTTKPGGMGMG